WAWRAHARGERQRRRRYLLRRLTELLDRPIALAGRLLALSQRQFEDEAGSLTGQRLGVQRAGVRLGEPARYRQAEPRASVPAARRAGAVEGLEHALELRRRDTRPAIYHPP